MTGIKLNFIAKIPELNLYISKDGVYKKINNIKEDNNGKESLEIQNRKNI